MDWGQDLFLLNDWIEANQSARPVFVTYFGAPANAGVPRDPRYASVSDADGFPPVGWYVINVNELHSRDRSYEYLKRLRPDVRIGYSTNIYAITEVRAAEIQKQMQLPARK